MKITPEIQALVGENWQEKQDFQIRFLKSQGLQPHHNLLDYGCGVLRGGIPLIKYLQFHRYYGYEPSRERWEIALRIIDSDEDLYRKKPTISIADDFFMLKFDYIWCYQVLIHMNDQELGKNIERISKLMKSSSRFYATVILNKKRVDNTWFEFPCVERPTEFYEEIFSKYNIYIEKVDNKHSTGEPALNNKLLTCRRIS